MSPTVLRLRVFLVVCSLALASILSRDAVASRDLSAPACAIDLRSPDAKHIFCAFGVKGTVCGTDWTCNEVNLWGGNPRRKVGWDCVCADHAKTIWSYLSVLTIGDRSAQQQGPLLQNQSTPFLIQYAVADSMFIVDSGQIQTDGTVDNFETLTGSGQVTGAFTLTLGSGPSNAIPVRITALNLTIASFLIRGRPTGPNQIGVTPAGAAVVGTYDSVEGVMSFSTPVLCTWTSSIYPGGKNMYVKPMLRSVGGGIWEMAPRGISDLPLSDFLADSPAVTPGTTIFLVALVLMTGIWYITRQRRARAEA